MSRKKRTKKVKEPKIEKTPEKKELDLGQLVSWSKQYANPWELPNFIKKLDGVGGIKESYTLVAFFQLVQILSVIIGTFIVFLITMPVLEIADFVSLILQLILSTIVGIAIFYASSWLLYILSKLLGGKVDFGNQTYVLSVLGLCHRVVFFVVLVFIYPSMVGALPLLFGSFAVLAMFIVSFYSWYVQFQVVKQLNNFSIWKSLGVLVIFLLVSAIIMSVFSFLLLGDQAIA